MDDTYLWDMFNMFLVIFVGCGLVAAALNVIEKIIKGIIALYRRVRG
jgi:hypothetical protein